jgi:hypothetical protein
MPSAAILYTDMITRSELALYCLNWCTVTLAIRDDAPIAVLTHYPSAGPGLLPGDAAAGALADEARIFLPGATARATMKAEQTADRHGGNTPQPTPALNAAAFRLPQHISAMSSRSGHRRVAWGAVDLLSLQLQAPQQA